MNAIQLIEEGKQFAAKLELENAEAKFSNALNSDPGSIDARIWLGKVALMRGQSNVASNFLKETLAIQPKDAEALALQGVSELQQGNLEAAVQYLESARKLDSGLDLVHSNLARCYKLSGKFEEAEVAARKALEINPMNAEAHFELAACMAKQNKMSDALVHCVNAINSNPFFVDAYIALATMFVLAGRAEKAIEVYRKGLTNMPNAHILRDHLCTLLFRQGDLQLAAEEAYVSVQRRNDYGDHLRLGIYALAAGKFELAENVFLKSTESNSNSWEGHYNLGELYAAAELMEQSRVQYEMAIEKGKEEWKPYNGMGLWFLRFGKQYDQAKKNFAQATRLEPGQPEPIMNLALANAGLRKWQEAEEMCLRLMDLAPHESKYYQEAEKLLAAIQSEKSL
jgi:tetratricopeptide (TPR) repeat protein